MKSFFVFKYLLLGSFLITLSFCQQSTQSIDLSMNYFNAVGCFSGTDQDASHFGCQLSEQQATTQQGGTYGGFGGLESKVIFIPAGHKQVNLRFHSDSSFVKESTSSNLCKFLDPQTGALLSYEPSRLPPNEYLQFGMVVLEDLNAFPSIKPSYLMSHLLCGEENPVDFDLPILLDNPEQEHYVRLTMYAAFLKTMQKSVSVSWTIDDLHLELDPSQLLYKGGLN